METPKIPATFAKVPWFVLDVLRQGKLKATDVCVYAVLAGHAIEKDSCYPSQARIADILGMSRRTVIECYKRLKASGLAATSSRGQRHARLVRLLTPNGSDLAAPVTATKPQRTAYYDGTDPNDPEPCGFNEWLAWKERKQARRNDCLTKQSAAQKTTCEDNSHQNRFDVKKTTS